MEPVILAPFRSDGGGRRDRNWQMARDEFWDRRGIPVTAWDSDGETFSRAQALNRAADYAGEWDVALVIDTDIVLAAWSQVEAALATAWHTGAYTVAHSCLHYIADGFSPEYGVSIETAQTWESAFAVRRDVWEAVGGFDERFIGYGFQGVAFFAACGTLAGRQRIEGNAFHLAHPPAPRDPEQFERNRELCNRYLSAHDNLEAMRALLAEERAA